MESYFTFLQKHQPLSRGVLYTYIVVDILYERVRFKTFKYTTLIDDLNQCHNPSQGLLCVLKGYFLKGMPHTFERNNVYTYIMIINYYIYNIDVRVKYNILKFHSLLLNNARFVQMNVVSCSMEDCITPLFELIVHEVIEHFVKGMPQPSKKVLYIQMLPREMLPSSERTPNSMEDIPYPFQKYIYIYGKRDAPFKRGMLCTSQCPASK